MGTDPAIEELRHRPPGSDPADPYADVDLESLPPWWRDAVEEFRAHDLRPYRPPRFADGTPVHDVVGDFSRAYDVEIGFGALGEGYRDTWSVRIDGEQAFAIPRHRAVEGYTVYEIEAEAFAARVREALQERAAER